MRAKWFLTRISMIIGLLAIVGLSLMRTSACAAASVQSFPTLSMNTGKYMSPPPVLSTEQTNDPDNAERAFVVALDLYQKSSRTEAQLELGSTKVLGTWAYSVAQESTTSELHRSPAFAVFLGHYMRTTGWRIYTPDSQNAATYNRVLADFPPELLDAGMKAFLGLPNPTITSPLNFSGHRFPWPYGTYATITGKDADPGGPTHDSQIDFSLEAYDIIASKSGTVLFVKESSPDNHTCSNLSCYQWANVVIIRHGDGEYSWYYHLAYSSVSVSEGDTVEFGTKIGRQGRTGFATGDHLHYMASTSIPDLTRFDRSNTDQAPWPPTGTIIRVDFAEKAWSELQKGIRYQSQNQGNSGGSCSAPSLTEPGDGATLSSRTITFRWNAVSGCTFNGYTFRIKNTSDMDSGGTTLIDTGEGGMQRTETINGWDNQDLYWGVKATNAPNGASWAVRRFRINPQSSSGSWRAEYYDSQDMWWNPNNTNWHSCGEDLSGPTLDKNYGTSAPCSGMRNNGDQWVGDYRGRITFSSGTYVFYSDHDDGARLWVEGLNNNNPIMEAGGSGNTTVCNGPTGYYLDGGKNIRVVLREEGGDARIKLWWDTNTATCLPKCYSLNTSANPSGSGWIGLDPQPNCAGGYTDGTNVQLTANPYSGYSFANWSGDLSGTTSPTSITVHGNKSVTVNFNVVCYSLSTSANPSSGGSVSTNPAPNCGSRYTAGTAVQLTANPNASHSFVNWSGTSSGSATTTAVTMDSDKAVVANFAAARRIYLPLMHR